MEVLINFIGSIGELVIGAFQFLVDTVKGLAYCVKMLTFFTASIPDYFAWIPDSCKTLIVLIFGVAVTYKILGREG